MTGYSKWLFIILGEDRTGKTKLQKGLVKSLSDDNRDYRLDCNLVFRFSHQTICKKWETFSIGNRSYQEKIDEYKTVRRYFSQYFVKSEIAFISSHLIESDIMEMITEGHRYFYNLCGIFLTNSIQSDETINRSISTMNWDDRLVLKNDITDSEIKQNNQIVECVEEIIRKLDII